MSTTLAPFTVQPHVAQVYILGVGLSSADGTPWGQADKAQATSDIDALLAALGCQVNFAGQGTGHYTNDAGEAYSEPSATWVFVLPSPQASRAWPNAVKALHLALAAWCLRWGQEAVALYPADVAFVRPTNPAAQAAAPQE